MSRQIEYYFTLQSTWAFIGHRAFHQLAVKHGLAVTYKPCWLGAVFKASGGLALKDRHPVRRAYRLVEMQRWRDKHRLDFDIDPPYFPFDPSLADKMLISILEQCIDPVPFMDGVFDALWRNGENPADRDVLIRIANTLGLDGQTLAKDADAEAISTIYRANTDEGVARHIVGSPAYLLEGEVFWGQDRLDLLEDALLSGRGPYLMPAPSEA